MRDRALDHAELIWRKLAAGQTQQAVADDLAWGVDFGPPRGTQLK
jgi:hypothetical protein